MTRIYVYGAIMVAIVSIAVLPAQAASLEAAQVEKVSFDQLPGWREDRQDEALAAFLGSCGKLLGMASDAMLGGGLLRHPAVQWRKPCHEARQMQPGDPLGARAFFERQFVPVAISGDTGRIGKFTGYYEPMVKGSYRSSQDYAVPVYGRPQDLPKDGGVYPLTRAQIEDGALKDKGLEKLWLRDPVDLFFLQVQGSGQVLLDTGERVALRFDGKTNQPYTAIGKILVERGELKRQEVSLPAIRRWLRDHPDQSQALMRQNEAYVFFSLAPATDEGPVGAQNVPLTPERSLAVDPTILPLGAPVYITTRLPNTPLGDGTPYNRLVVAQDTGSAITGAVRGDVFFGNGERAEALAGHMNSEGGYYVLLPKAVADRLPDAGGRAVRRY